MEILLQNGSTLGDLPTLIHSSTAFPPHLSAWVYGFLALVALLKTVVSCLGYAKQQSPNNKHGTGYFHLFMC